MFTTLRRLSFFLSIFLLTLIFPLVGAIDVQSASGTWTNPSGNPSNFSGGGTNEVHWGNPTSGSNNSGYNFTSLAPILNLATDTPFALGVFTHYNFPITGNFLTGIDLNVSALLNLNGTPQAFSTVYHFLHNETPNTGGNNCCNDIVTFQNNLPQSSVFNIGGIDYTIELLGFKTSVYGPLLTQFSTIEGQQNTATLFATISQPQVLVPEPSTYFILGSLLLITMFWYRKRNLQPNK